MGRQVVHHDDVVGAKGWDQHLLDISKEGLTGHRAIEHHWRAEAIAAARQQRWWSMRQTETAGVRLDHGKAAASGIARQAIQRFGCERRRSRSKFVAAEPPGTEDRAKTARLPGSFAAGRQRADRQPDADPVGFCRVEAVEDAENLLRV